MWHKAEWMGRPMRLELTRVGLLVNLANRYTTRGAHINTHIYLCVYVSVCTKDDSQGFRVEFFITIIHACQWDVTTEVEGWVVIVRNLLFRFDRAIDNEMLSMINEKANKKKNQLQIQVRHLQ